MALLDPLDGDLALALRQEFTYKNPQYEKLRAIGVPAWGEPREVSTFRLHGRHTYSFPRGGFSRVREVLHRHGVEFTVDDQRTEGEHFGETIPDHRVELYPYQLTARDVLADCENCLLRAGTGSGKTTVAFAVAAKLKLPTLVIVWSGNLHDQWVGRARSELGMSARDVGIVRGSKRVLRPLTIAMQQSLAQPGVIDEEMRATFGVVICDEVQRFAARTLFACVDPFPSRFRFGISADERRTDGKEFLIYDLFGQPRVEIPKEDLIESGHVLDVEFRVVPTDFQAPWYDGARGDFGRLLDEVCADGARNEIVLRAVAEEAASGEQVIVLSHRREHCVLLDREIAARGVRTGLLIGGPDYAPEFRRTREGLEGGRLRVGVGTIQAIGQGIDLPKVAVAVIATPVAGNRQLTGQVRGRVCRIAAGKSDARAYYLWDRHVYGTRHLENLVRWNARVVVRSGDEWVDGRTYLKQWRSSVAV